MVHFVLFISDFFSLFCSFPLVFVFQVGDRIVSICGTSTEGMTHSQAVSLLKNASGTIEIQVKNK